MVRRIVRLPYARDGASLHTGGLVARLLLAGVLVYAWGAILLDQLPCFLGIPNCD